MALLTKAERQSLTSDERRELRSRRRAEKASDRPLPAGVRVLFPKLRRRAAELVLEYVRESIPGESRMDEVIDELVDEADGFLVWSWAGPAGMLLEAVDGVALRAMVKVLIKPEVQKVYEGLRDTGVLEVE
jgi:hypothetical protein